MDLLFVVSFQVRVGYRVERRTDALCVCEAVGYAFRRSPVEYLLAVF